MYQKILVVGALVILCTTITCGPKPHELGQAMATVCSPAASFGAIPDDNLDDRAAIQAAIFSCPHAVMPPLAPGRYYINIVPGMRAGLLDARNGAVISGAGLNTRIVFRGSAGNTDMIGISLGAGSRLHHLSIGTTDLDGGPSLATNTNEHSRIVMVIGPVADVRIDHVSIDNPQHADSRGGDCIQCVGYAPAQLITLLKVDHVRFVSCARCGIAMHSGVAGARIDHNQFSGIRTVGINEEGPGGLSNIEIDHNTFASSGVSIELASATKHRLHDNWTTGGGYWIYQTTETTIYDDNIWQTASAWPGIGISGVSAQIELENVSVQSLASSALQVSTGHGMPLQITTSNCKWTGAIDTTGYTGLVQQDDW